MIKQFSRFSRLPCRLPAAGKLAVALLVLTLGANPVPAQSGQEKSKSATGGASALPSSPAEPTGILLRGTPYATPYFVIKGSAPGPTVFVAGGLHGDEPAGYLAARQLCQWEVQRGTLVIVPDAHAEAIRRKVRAYPRNMNRLFPGNPRGDAMEQLAHAIWTLMKDSKPALVLTLHESRDFHARNRTRYGQTFTYDFHATTPYIQRVLARVNAKIPARLEKFLPFVAPFKTCPTYVATHYLKVPSASIETAKPLPLARRIQLQLLACEAFFAEAGVQARRPQPESTAGRTEPRPPVAKPPVTNPPGTNPPENKMPPGGKVVPHEDTAPEKPVAP